ncbi:hypothetical protein CAPTEDRAFT_95296 [Capitella teleta]|uniref:Fatty acid hydroxylase domain-containing protein n=1 Tax=Capitella teleta TaxID=283909 RepID=R7TDT5_CAPTE|nr:hypothetical protein CAPTEDRAFT_95296 [Capitella teleta]|eukprot:ELT89652.1 hypothetical protein CAPTEDRAFT_95296 [Capitella teleta]
MESLLEVAVGALISKDNPENNSISEKSICEAVPGEWRLLQPVWDLRIGYEEYVSSPLFPIVVSVSFYFACILPWMVFDLYGRHWNWIQRYKIQPKHPVTWEQVSRAMVLTFWNHILYILPVSIAQWVWTPSEVLPVLAPFLWDFCWHQFAALIVFDFEYFAWHAIHHRVRWLYRNVHALHHEYHSPSSWVTQYLHPWELISVGVFTTTSPWIFSAHFLTQISFMLLGILVSVEAHIGYDLPLMPHHWAPFWGGGIKHDMHHQRPRTNFEPFFNWWDRLLGTECPGQLAGGRRPKILEDYDARKKEEVRRRRAGKKIN